MIRQQCDMVVEGMADFDRPAVTRTLRKHPTRAWSMLPSLVKSLSGPDWQKACQARENLYKHVTPVLQSQEGKRV